MRLALLTTLLVCGCTTTTVVCDIEPFLDPYVSGRPTDDCGTFDFDNDTASTLDAARKCVITAINTANPTRGFRMVWTVQKSPNHLRAGLAGVASGGMMFVHQFAYTGDVSGVPGDKHPKVSVQTCTQDAAHSAIFATAGCVIGPGKPCMTCNAPISGQLLCGG